MRRPQTFRKPQKPVTSSAEDSLHSKIMELDQEISMLNSENTLLKGKVKRVDELEDKIQLLLRQNTNLLNENQQLSRLLNKMKSEGELLKNKYEALMIQSTTKENELKKLKNQFESLNHQVIEADQLKKMKIGETKSHLNQTQLVNEVKTLKDSIAAKNQEIQGLIKERNQSKVTFESEIRRLKAKLDSSEQYNKQAQQVYDTNIERLEKEIKSKNEEIRVLEATFNDQVSPLNNELGLVQNLLKEKVGEFKNYSKQAETNEKSLNQQIKTVRNNLDDLAREHERLKGQSSTYESRIQNLNDQIGSLEEQNQEKNSIIATLKATIEVKDGELGTQGKNVATLERMLGKAMRELEEHKVQGGEL